MLTLYKRHLATCIKGHTDRRIGFNKRDLCKCPIWTEGMARNGEYLRRSLKTNSKLAAEEKVAAIENPKPQERITIRDALDAFVNDCEVRNLHPRTLGKHRRLRTRLADFAEREGLRDLDSMTVGHLRRHRAEWTFGARTALKELERLKSFFNFCVENDWLAKSPAKAIRPPKITALPRVPFSEDEVNRIISRAGSDRELAFLLTLRHTGLRIGNASLLKDSQISGNRVFLYVSKSGNPVSILVPDSLASLYKRLPKTAGHFFLFGESTHVHSVSNLWRRRIKAICKELGILPDHPHRFRHSLAADLLSKGVSVENVAAILGNSPSVVIKHYSQWIRSRQEALDAAIASTWEPQLKLVKK